MPLDTKEISIQEMLRVRHRDAVLWKAESLWTNAMDVDSQAGAIEEITAMLMCMRQEAKRSSYISAIADEQNNRAKAHAKQVVGLEKEIEGCEKVVKRLQAKKKTTPEDETLLRDTLSHIKDVTTELDELKANVVAELQERILTAQVKTAVKEKKQRMEAMQMDAKLQQNIKSAADVGLPDDFKGNIKDILDAIKYGIYLHDNIYYSRGPKGDYAISNFTMKIFYHVKTGDENAFRLIAVKNVYGIEVTINMNTDDFVSLGSFKKVLARHGDFVFKGADSDLSRLQEYLQRDEVSTKNINTMGWHKQGQFWAWGNGISPASADFLEFMATDMHGIVDYNNKKYLIPAGAKMYEDKDEEFVTEKKFIYMKPAKAIDFTKWCSTMEVVYKKRAIPGILFYVASVYRDVIFKQSGKFPLLNLFGPPGSGKSEMAMSLMAMMGGNTSPISLEGESTGKSYMRKVAQVRNGLVWLDEFKNNQAKHTGNLKNFYDGTGYDRAKMTNDNQTKQTPVNSSVILSGQEMPTAEPALFTRVILVSFEEGKFTSIEQDNFQLLKKDYEANGLSYITAGLMKHRGIVEQEFSSRQPVIFKELVKDVANGEMKDRMILNISILVAMYDILKDVVKFPFKYTEAKAVLIESIKHQHSILQGADNAARFWSIVELLFHQNLIFEGKDFELEDGYLYISIISVHPLYIKEMHAQRDPNFLAKSTLEYYLKLDLSKYCDYKRRRFDNGANVWCYVMRYAALGIDLIKAPTGHMGDKAAFMEAKYKEMGVGTDVDSAAKTKGTPAEEYAKAGAEVPEI